MPSTVRFANTAKVLAECNLEYYRISECPGAPAVTALLSSIRVHQPHLTSDPRSPFSHARRCIFQGCTSLMTLSGPYRSRFTFSRLSSCTVGISGNFIDRKCVHPAYKLEHEAHAISKLCDEAMYGLCTERKAAAARENQPACSLPVCSSCSCCQQLIFCQNAD